MKTHDDIYRILIDHLVGKEYEYGGMTWHIGLLGRSNTHQVDGKAAQYVTVLAYEKTQGQWGMEMKPLFFHPDEQIWDAPPSIIDHWLWNEKLYALREPKIHIHSLRAVSYTHLRAHETHH
mgnify:CR=1 FL=1